MQQFQPILRTNQSSNIQQLFNIDEPNLHSKYNSLEFKPFSRERNGINKLLSKDNSDKNPQSIAFSMRKIKSQRKISEDLLSQLSERGKTTDKKVEKIFKKIEINAKKPLSEANKMKIISKNEVIYPAVGTYDADKIEENLKFYKQKSCRIIQERENMVKIKTIQNGGSKQQQKERWVGSKQIDSKVKESIKIKLQIDFNLPELQKYHEMKRLKMKVSDNFEANHLKFKEKIRFSQVLANKIRKDLEME